MVRFFLCGDSHIPRRAKSIPDKLIDKLEDLTNAELFDYTFFTGDVIIAPEFIKSLEKITKTPKNLFFVIGNMDYYGGNRNSPVFQELKLLFSDGDNITVGLTHGAQIQPRGDHLQLETLAIKKIYNILITGHTHKEEIFLTDKGILLINPGSVTGAWSFVASGIPSFIVLKIKEDTKEINLSLFQLDKKTQKISEIKSYFIFKDNRVIARF
ncbi:MAG: YfcE family phosphodiesterase [Promethearchaeota archaeon]|nr:MAG: YfcE family phosphodiesterase [Candidatus Lokiarchaeota archaeon]